MSKSNPLPATDPCGLTQVIPGGTPLTARGHRHQNYLGFRSQGTEL